MSAIGAGKSILSGRCAGVVYRQWKATAREEDGNIGHVQQLVIEMKEEENNRPGDGYLQRIPNRLSSVGISPSIQTFFFFLYFSFFFSFFHILLLKEKNSFLKVDDGNR